MCNGGLLMTCGCKHFMMNIMFECWGALCSFSVLFVCTLCVFVLLYICLMGVCILWLCSVFTFSVMDMGHWVCLLLVCMCMCVWRGGDLIWCEVGWFICFWLFFCVCLFFVGGGRQQGCSTASYFMLFVSPLHHWVTMFVPRSRTFPHRWFVRPREASACWT